ncbi:MAG: HPr family phosphocarrier protein [Oscillospiraceae bacterium]|nr:HPr family phosphocarrier protein [Oscillospiraceae bacterium]
MTAKKIKFTGRDAIESVKGFVSIVSKCKYDIDIVSGRYVVDAKSIMGLFSLDLSTELALMIHSDDCDELIAELEDYIVQRPTI